MQFYCSSLVMPWPKLLWKSKHGASRYNIIPTEDPVDINKDVDQDLSSSITTTHDRCQLLFISLSRLAEPVASASIVPYTYHYIRHLNNCSDLSVGYYIGLLSAAYALSQFLTGFLWGALSDRIGRKKCILIGLAGSALSHILWGLSTSLQMAFIAKLLGGGLNANVSMYKSMIGEMGAETRSIGFAVLSGLWAVGSVFGSYLGGRLAFSGDMMMESSSEGLGGNMFCRFPALLPSVVVASLLIAALVLAAITLEDTHVKSPPRITFSTPKSHKRRNTSLKITTRSYLRSSDAERNMTPLLSSSFSPRTPMTPYPPRYRPNSSKPLSARLPPSPSQSAVIISTTSNISTTNPPQTLYNTLTSPSYLFFYTCSYILLTLQTSSYSDLITLLSSTPTILGGLALPQASLSTLFATASLFSAIAQFAILYLFRTKTSIIHLIITFCLPLIAVMTPVSHEIIGLGAVMITQGVCEAVGYSVLGVLISEATPREMLGRVNGALFSLGALARVLGPLGLSWLFAVETQSKGGSGVWVPWSVLGGIGVLGVAVVVVGRWWRMERP